MQIFIITMIAIILAVGFFRLQKSIKNAEEKILLANEFLSKLVDFVSSKGEDISVYDWLTKNADLVQANLGGVGIAKMYKPAFANYYFENFELVINLLPLLYDMLLKRNRLAIDHYNSLREILVRYIGIMEVHIERLEKRKKNPFVWFFEGLRIILIFPFYVFQWAGLISNTTITKIQYSFLFRIITFMAAVAGFVSSLITIVDEWDRVMTFLTKLRFW